MTVDKIPAADTINDMINTFIRPAAGAILFDAGKATTRPAVTVTTVGTGNWLVSLAEDVIAFITTVISILIPTLVVFFVLLILFVTWWWRRRRNRKAGEELTSGG